MNLSEGPGVEYRDLRVHRIHRATENTRNSLDDRPRAMVIVIVRAKRPHTALQLLPPR